MSAFAQVIIGWFVIDLITGVYHLCIDRMSPDSRLARWTGLHLQVKDFMDHHENPRSMEAFGFVARVLLPTIGGLLAIPFAFYGWPWFWGTVFVGAVMSQQAHYWSHAENRPAFVKWLQTIGVIISPEQHERHHRDFTRSFGVLNGWSHGFLDGIRGVVR